MSERPKRIQRSHAKGSRMSPGAIYVGRPSRWGNRWRVVNRGPAAAVALFREDLDRMSAEDRAALLAPLRGHDLACWCPLIDENGNPVPCHADVLLELANG